MKGLFSMTQADSVHSTPPTNTSPTRRNILGTIAAAGATALTLKPARAAAPAPDPIYAAIERHKAACIPWDAAIDVRAEFPEGPHPMTDEQREQRDALDEAVDEARDPLEKAGMALINATPTTPAGIVTAICCMQRQMRNDGTYMPYEIEFKFDDLYEGDGGMVLAWIDAWLNTLAEAAAELNRAGKAVQS
jgi:hypothetical protein